MDIQYLTSVIGKLKDLQRTGWIRKEISAPETTAAHSWGVIFLSYLLCPPELDRDKCLKLALFHDIAEALTGDCAPGDLPPVEKRKQEYDAVKQISGQLQTPEILEYYLEYEAKGSREARFVQDIDKLDTAMEACYYNKTRDCPIAAEFMEYAQKRYLGGHNCEEILKIYKQLSNI